MPLTPDRTPGPSDEEELILSTNASPSTNPGSCSFDGTDFVFRDSTGVFNPRTGGSGITESQHRALNELIHLIAETNYTEVERTSGQISAVRVWTTSGKTQKIREYEVSRTLGQISQIVVKQYDDAGVLIPTTGTMTGTVNRSGGRIANIDWVLS